MRRILLVIAYDGTNYHGWQAQNDVGAVPTIEGALLTALGQLIPGETPAITLKLKPGADVLESATELVEDLKLASEET